MFLRRKRNVSFIIALVLILIIFFSYVLLIAADNILDKEELFTVDEILDGDTILIETGDYVRLIGIDAPEKDEEFYNESKTFLTSLILNKKVSLEKDQEEVDNYGRLLRYVYLDTTNINLEMVNQGYARPMHIEPDTSQKEKIDLAWEECKVNLCKK